MKKINLFFLFISLLAFQIGYSQALTFHDPSVSNPLVEIKEKSEEGTLSFEFVQQLSPYALNNNAQPVRMTISLMNIRLKEGIPSIKGTYASKFAWQYDEAKNYLLATQIAQLNKDEVGVIEMEYKVINAPSCESNQRIGFNVNIQPAACMNGVNEIENDNVHTYTCQPTLSTSLEELATNSYQIFPNPTKDQVTIQLAQISQNLAITILDIQGKMVKQYVFEHAKEAKLDVTNFPGGTYSMMIQTDEKIANEKLIIIE